MSWNNDDTHPRCHQHSHTAELVADTWEFFTLINAVMATNDASHVSATRLISPVLSSIAWQTSAISDHDDLTKCEGLDSFKVCQCLKTIFLPLNLDRRGSWHRCCNMKHDFSVCLAVLSPWWRCKGSSVSALDPMKISSCLNHQIFQILANMAGRNCVDVSVLIVLRMSWLSWEAANLMKHKFSPVLNLPGRNFMCAPFILNSNLY